MTKTFFEGDTCKTWLPNTSQILSIIPMWSTITEFTLKGLVLGRNSKTGCRGTNQWHSEK